MLEKLFRLKEHGTNCKIELVAGLTSFLTMAYVLAVNPAMLSMTGMDPTAVLLATAIASFIGTLCMGLFANLPFAMSTAMGSNAFFTYTVCIGMGYPWELALLAIFAEGILFLLLTVTNVRTAIFNAIPVTMKRAVSVGIGLFVAFIGLQNGGLCVAGSNLVALRDFRQDFSSAGIGCLLCIIGIFLTAVLFIRGFKMSLLMGILVTWGLGMICQAAGLYVPNPELGYYSLFPTLGMTDFSKLEEGFAACFRVDYSQVDWLNFGMVVILFLFVNLFDTMGSLIGVAAKAGMLDEKGHLKGLKGALYADSVSIAAGSVLGTSATFTFVESAAGVSVGGRTGLTAVVTGLFFLASTLLAPVFTAIPSFATAPALIVVGFLIVMDISDIDFKHGEMTEIIPAFLTIIAMPLFYSISEGVSVGVISYVILNVCMGKGKKVSLVMYLLCAAFILKYIFL